MPVREEAPSPIVRADPPHGPRPGQTGRRRRLSRRAVVALTAGGVVVALGVPAAWAVDRFVIDHVEIADVSAYEAANGVVTSEDVGTSGSRSTVQAAEAATVTDSSYVDDETSITITTVITGSGADTVTYYVADVLVTDATQIRSAFAEDSYGTNIVEHTSDIAQANDAVVAVNGDYYGFRDDGILIRNGVIYRDDGVRTGLAFYADGTIAVYDETETSAEELLAAGVWNTLSFGPALLEDGQVIEGIEDVEVDTNVGNHSIQGEQPRTGIGMISANHLVFVVVDGRSPGYSRGVTMTEFAQIFADLGCTVAYNIDGGGSSTMYFNGEVVNDPLGKGRERGTSDILYVG